jgi:hypothetical protein
MLRSRNDVLLRHWPDGFAVLPLDIRNGAATFHNIPFFTPFITDAVRCLDEYLGRKVFADPLIV